MSTTATNLRDLAVDVIGSAGNARTGAIDEGEDFEALLASVRERGILAPVLVTEGDPDASFSYLLVDGHRRLAAARAAGLERIPARVVAADDQVDADVLAMVANVRRLNLDPVEEADAYARILEANGWTQKRLAESLGVTTAHLSGRLKLARLPEGVRAQVAAGTVPLAAVATVERIAATSPAIAEALVTDERLARAGAPATPEGAARALTDLTWKRRQDLQGDAPTGVPFLVQLGREGGGSLASFGLDPAAHPELAAALEEKRGGDTWVYVEMVDDQETLEDQARAFGCLLEADGCSYVTDEAWWADRVAAAIAAYTPPERTTGASPAAGEDEKEAKARERDEARKEAIAAGARNRDLERVLRVALSRPEEITPAAARLLAAAALEEINPGRVALVFADLHTVTSTGTGDKRREKTKTVPGEATSWLREWVGELEDATAILGRAAAVLLAHHLADDLALPPSQRPYTHEKPHPLQHVEAAAPEEVDPALVARFRKRNEWMLQVGDGDGVPAKAHPGVAEPSA